jgi:hypothetical protein
MSVISFEEGDLFRITIVKYLATNPDRKWGNNYEARAKAGGGTTDLTGLGMKILDFEQAMHWSVVQFSLLRISTWEPDSTPYDPTVFMSLPLTGAGDTAIDGNQLTALNVCLDVGRVPVSGRFGHIYYRGALTEGLIQAPAGKSVLNSPSTMQDQIDAALEASNLDVVLNGSDSTFELVMINTDGTQVREVIGFTVRGVAVVPFEHAWFNRTPAS